jgi:hypothetical protein
MPIIHVPALRRTVTIKLHQFPSGLLQPTGSPITVGSQIVQSGTSLEGLSDVVIGTPSDGDVLTYDADLDKYVLKAISLIDGGTF